MASSRLSISMSKCWLQRRSEHSRWSNIATKSCKRDMIVSKDSLIETQWRFTSSSWSRSIESSSSQWIWIAWPRVISKVASVSGYSKSGGKLLDWGKRNCTRWYRWSRKSHRVLSCWLSSLVITSCLLCSRTASTSWTSTATVQLRGVSSQTKRGLQRQLSLLWSNSWDASWLDGFSKRTKWPIWRIECV